MKIKLANPRGFCAGVDRAIDIVDRALDIFGPPIYVRHEVVHNKFVVEGLKERGAIFVDEVADVPDDKIIIFSAHGVAKKVEEEAKQRGLKIFDATCPLVSKVHMQVVQISRAQHECILIGHANHPEVEGTMGRFDASEKARIYLIENIEAVEGLSVEDEENLHYVTQTTLSVDDTKNIISALKDKFPSIKGPRKDDVCYATQNRQDAVKQLALECDLLLVVGAPNSSNSNRLSELAIRCGVESYLIERADEIDEGWLQNKTSVGVTAGASAPEPLVQEVVEKLVGLGATSPDEIKGKEETVTFGLPKELR